MKLCVPIIETDVNSFINKIKEVQEVNVDLIELRIDYLDNISEVLDQILQVKSNKPYILTIRKASEGGKSSLDENTRMNLFLKAMDRVNYIDVEYSSEEIAKKLIDKKKCKIILSMHDFEKTPSKRELNNIIDEMFNFGADIAKIAVMCKSYDDSIKLIELLDHWKNKDVIIIGMGSFGTFTRILSPIFDPFLNFVSLSLGRESAPGQITLEQMHKFMAILKRKE